MRVSTGRILVEQSDVLLHVKHVFDVCTVAAVRLIDKCSMHTIIKSPELFAVLSRVPAQCCTHLDRPVLCNSCECDIYASAAVCSRWHSRFLQRLFPSFQQKRSSKCSSILGVRDGSPYHDGGLASRYSVLSLRCVFCSEKIVFCSHGFT